MTVGGVEAALMVSVRGGYLDASSCDPKDDHKVPLRDAQGAAQAAPHKNGRMGIPRS